MKLINAATYLWFFLLALEVFAFDFYEGEAPFIKANPTLSKVFAIEDALLKASYKTGGDFYSETQLRNQINYEERISLMNNQTLSEIFIKSCDVSSSKMKCLVGLKYLKKSVLKPKGEFIKPCDEPSSDFLVCYKVSDQKSHYANGFYITKGRFSLLVKNSGIVRYEEIMPLYGLGESEELAHSSLIRQAELKAFQWSKHRFLLLESEKQLVTRVFSRSRYKKEKLLVEGLFPIQVIERNNQVYVFCRTIQFN